jgi:hypothetical protein
MEVLFNTKKEKKEEKTKKKNPMKIAKELRAKKREWHPAFIKHELTPKWVDQWEFPIYNSCFENLGSELHYGAETFYKFKRCGVCHACGKHYVAEPNGDKTLEFEAAH